MSILQNMNKQLKYIKYYTFITIPAEGAILVMFHFTARFNNIYIHILIFGHMQTQSEGLNFYFEIVMYTYINIRDAPVDRPKIGTGRFLLIMRDRQPAGFCLFFGRFFRKCEHVICVEDIRQEHNKQKNRYNEANCRWCNMTGTQIRAAFICCSC